MATAYGLRPSDFFPRLETDIARWNLDEACLVVGRKIENMLNQGKDPWRELDASQAERKPGLYRSAKAAFKKAIRKVKFNKKGIW